MIREIDLSEISDGKRYGHKDMVKAGCNDCKGCSKCCQGMGHSIVLDPYDVYLLAQNLKQSFEEMLSYAIELQVAEGIILPNLKMTGAEEKCSFLNEQGRCSIHGFRPGFCRMFPLGRIYENNDFQYFLQVKECPQEPETKVKLQKWLGIGDIRKYEVFVKDWHYFLKEIQELLEKAQDETLSKQFSVQLLQLFYIMPYETEQDFYSQFYLRLKEMKKRFL